MPPRKTKAAAAAAAAAAAGASSKAAAAAPNGKAASASAARANGQKAASANDASASAAFAAAGSTSTTTAVAYPSVSEAKDLVAELCASFYRLGWVSGTGGGLSMRAGPSGESVVMAPSGVQKERMRPEDMFVLRASDGEVVETPRAPPPPAKPPKLSECAPLFMSAYELRDAGAVVHSHSLNAVAATLIQGEHSKSFKATHLEMCKGVDGHGFRDVVEVPIVENTARECELTDRLRAAIRAYPKSNAVFVRRHGIYVWGSTWARAKAQAETYDYLFEAALRLREVAGIDVSVPPPGARALAEADAEEARAREGAAAGGAAAGEAEPARKRARVQENGSSSDEKPRCVVVDIEGTVLPIAYVKTEMFPFARERLRDYLLSGFHGDTVDPKVQRQIDALREEQRAEGEASSSAAGGGGRIPSDDEARALAREEAASAAPPGLDATGGDAAAAAAVALGEAAREKVVGGCVAYLESLMDRDVKSTALKEIQGSIWTRGFEEGKLEAPLFADVAGALRRWSSSSSTSLSSKVYIYSSGSRRAQRDLFAHTSEGDMRPHLSGFFDTTSGAKVVSSSYENIALSLGVDDPSKEILFLTDVLAEAEAAKAAGWGVALVSREGNAPLPEGHGFKVVESFDELF